MDLFCLVENEKLLAQIVEFENEQLAVYWFDEMKLLFCHNMIDFCHTFVYGDRNLIREGVKTPLYVSDSEDEKEDDIEKAKDVLYSA